MIFFISQTPVISTAGTINAQDIIRPDTPWRINAQKITYNQKTHIYTATGDVKIYKDDKTLYAESIQYNQDTMEAESKGGVRLTVGKDTLRGDEIIINLKTGIGTIINGSIFIEKSHFIIKGDKILKTGENSYTINNGSITTCDGDLPPWQITGKKIDITIEEYGTVRHAALWTKKFPVFYVPYLIFPVNIERQSGLLPPQMGYSSRNGIEFIQPYYWAINKSSDATFYYHHIQKRGEKFGAEYRYALSNFSKGTLMMDFLDDRKVDDGTGDSSQNWGYSDDPFLRENTDRYWFRTKLNQKLSRDFTSKLDLDIVSDQDYLNEFDSGYSGYDAAKKYFESEFGRDIDDQNDSVRTNSFNINKIWTQYSFNAELLWYDNVINRRQNETDSTLQQLPVITFNALRQSVLNNLLFVDMDSGFSNFYRQDGMTGQRIDVYPRIYLPMHYKNYFTFEPSAGFRETAWYSDRTEEDLQGLDEYDYQHREIYDLGAELSTDLFNVYQMNGKSINKIKHTFIPRLEYSYIPDVDQTKYPEFDDTDRIAPENLMTFSLTNLLISKAQGSNELIAEMPVKNPDTPFKKTDELSALDSYNQFLWFKIEQSYDFIMKNEPDGKPFYPLYAELTLTPVNRLSLHAETEWNHDSGNFTTFNTYCKIKNSRKDHLTIEHRYIRNENQSIYLDFNGAVTDTISIFGNYERNLKDSVDIETKLGCHYQAQCWSCELFYKEKDDDQKIGFMISLKGLAHVGSEL
ncbi:MAG: LPS-assembly protein LptD [Desulfobacteraceae bacterium]|nr:LPS-assembly protein LptD [Desulfobacteraceae bacterium]MBC2757343.1 LPS-assembly protein LptD [Desulfobacteraceae bacterium]MBC2763943.1 LPS-assembly protein LptD [ANME-2 cluster archaeon]